jgi:hypothetical protein
MTSTNDTSTALYRVFVSWLAVGISQMSPLQVVQFIAAIFAIVYTALQTYKLVREMWAGKGA